MCLNGGETKFVKICDQSSSFPGLLTFTHEPALSEGKSALGRGWRSVTTVINNISQYVLKV